MPERIPAFGCAAVPSPTKKLMIVWAAASGVGSADARGVAAAAAGLASRVLIVDFLLEVAVVLAGSEPDGIDETVLSDDLGRTFFFGAAECPVDFDDPPADELLDVEGPLDPAEPVESAAATAGIEAIAAPTPRATADAPSHVNACELASAARPKSTRFNCIRLVRSPRRPFNSVRSTP
ncbi:hypothetical protein CRM90_15515 [Mycobacterium sp. ENV421]|nr:hypothetical protein CRM90_15515 [Mycobacterium sp. ENV421]